MNKGASAAEAGHPPPASETAAPASSRVAIKPPRLDASLPPLILLASSGALAY